ncbi:hypothetical protein DL769_001859 [Monosporascus sp. CRB-8-3]|nr:hypothetical protein DL769_001859 [Monosporascus sp. CRB-8-3]
MVLRKKDVYTVVTPIPGFIPRQLAIDILHSHGEVITLNPLVLSHRPIPAPRDAVDADEYFATWYEITERVQYVPGLGRLGSGVISFRGCFHDLPWGLQTHIYAPAGVDLRVRYRIAGNQPGVEPPASRPEIGVADAPRDGLYLREDIEIRCNIAMMGLVKSQMKAASKEMVARIIKKAELLDAGVLQAMIEDGKLKTVNPRDRSYAGGASNSNTSTMSPPVSPLGPPQSPSVPYQVPRPLSLRQQSRPGTSSSQYTSHYLNPYEQSKLHQHAAELPNAGAPKPQAAPSGMIMELPGDYYHAPPGLQPPPRPANTHPIMDRTSTVSSVSHSPEPTGGWRWSSGGSQPSPPPKDPLPASYSPYAGSAGFTSPELDRNGFAAGLPTHPETREEYRDLRDAPASLVPAPLRPYNPAEYGKVSR